MPSENIVNLELMLGAFTGDNPAGVDVREDPSPTSPYQNIKAARNAARAAERNSIHDGSSNEADEHWRAITTLAPEILANYSKDLEIASWYTEALLRSSGFQGLRDGFAIIHGLIEAYWENLYPMPDEDGIETRVACIAGLNGEGAEGVLVAPIRKAKITEGSSVGPFTFWEYQQALEAQKLPDEKARNAKKDKLGFDISNIETAVSESSTDYFINLRDDLNEAILLYKKTGQMLDEHCGAYDAPPTRTIIEVLDECLGAVNHLAKHKFPVEVEEAEDGAEQPGEADSAGEQSTKRVQGPVANREDAFKQLVEIADFFRRTEPHSPVSYVLEKAVKWGNMPLTALMQELIPDSSSRNHYSELTGVISDEE
ncbi:type VI secretion system protein ImpA [Alteromonadaceae bacterium Bs31]|nr:type VI secretion system protein ImpA [Alteromonadaceae bacterium Bs31]